MRKTAQAMMIARLKAIGAAVLAIATLAGLAGVLTASMAGNEGTRPSGSRPIVKEVPAPLLAEGPEKAGVDETIVFRGRVLGPDGKPAAGAAISTVAPRPGEDDAEPIARAKAAQDGTFHFVITREAFDEATGKTPWSTLTVLASAEGLGLDWVEVHDPPRDELTLRLVDDSVPIAGRILDLQGRPVVGAKVTRGRIVAEGPEGIDAYLRLMRDDPMAASNHRFARSYHGAYGLPGRPSSVVTDAQGRFRLAGIGRDRIVNLNVEGPTIQSATVAAMTRNAPAVSMPKTFFRPRTVYRRDLRPPHTARPRIDGRRDGSADGAAAGRREGRRQRDKRPHDHGRPRAVHTSRLPEGQELRLDGPGEPEASVFRDLPGRLRYRGPRSAPGRRRLRAGHPDAAQADRQGDRQGTQAGGGHLLAAVPQPAYPRGPRPAPGAEQRGVQRGGPASGWDLPPGRPARPGGRARPRGRRDVPAGVRRPCGVLQGRGPSGRRQSLRESEMARRRPGR